MPSARYTLNIDPEDLKPEAPRQLTGREKAANWWHYHYKALALIAALAALAAWLVADLVTQERPDYQVALVTDRYIPDEVLTSLEQALAPFGQDLNGDGETLVRVMGYQLDLSQSGPAPTSAPAASGQQAASAPQSAALSVDIYTQMAGVTTLNGDIDAGTSLIFLVEHPAQFQAAFGVLASAQGQLPEPYGSLDGADLYAWGDCPVLAGLDLAQYAAGLGQNLADPGEYLQRFYVARRGFAQGKGPEQYPAENEALFAALTEGAVSTPLQ